MREKATCTVRLVLDTDDPYAAADLVPAMLSENAAANGIVDWAYARSEAFL